MSALTHESNTHPLESFFGPYQGTHETLRADDALAHETYNLPEAYVGKNKYLESILDWKIRKEDEFYTRDLLPWEFTDDLHIAWEIFSFNRTLIDLEPHQGVPRYVSAQSERHTDNLLRRGLAFIIEHGFYKTQRGKRHFALNLQQISDAVHVTCYFGVIHAMLGGNNYYKEWQRKFGRQVKRVNDLMSREKHRWAIVQKEENGLYLLDAELKHEMKREGVVPNIWVWPDKMGIYANMVGEHNMDYHKRGELANQNREKGDQKGTFRGLPVFEAQSFDVDFTGEPIDLLIREQQCGEYFYMKNKGEGNSDIIIYSADSDKFERITWDEASNAAELTEAGINGTESNEMQSDEWTRKVGYDAIVRIFVNAQGQVTGKRVMSLLSGSQKEELRLTGTVTKQGSGDEYDEDTYEFSEELPNGYIYERILPLAPGYTFDAGSGNAINIHNGYDIMLFRPSQTYRMASAILAKGGSDTGSCYHGHHDFQLSDDIIRKVHVGHYTFYSKAVVKRPKNYVIVENIFSQGYVDGEGTTFPTANPGNRVEDFFTSVQEGTGRPDLIAFKVPRGTDQHLNNVVDITGRFDSGIYDQLKTHQDQSQEHFPRSNIVYNAMNAFDIDMYRESPDDEYLQRIKRVNTVCWRGMQLDSNRKITQLNTGHWGEQIYPGVRKVREGEMSFMKDMQWAKAMSFVPSTNVAQEDMADRGEF